MTNNVAISSGFPKDSRTGLTPPLRTLLDSQDLIKHRAMIAFEQEALAIKYDRFGWERDKGTPVHDRLVKDWMEALQDYPLDEVQAACKAAVRDNPNKMPNEGHVRAQIMAARAKVVALHPKPAEESPVAEKTPEERQRMADLVARSFPSIKRFGGEA